MVDHTWGGGHRGGGGGGHGGAQPQQLLWESYIILHNKIAADDGHSDCINK